MFFSFLFGEVRETFWIYSNAAQTQPFSFFCVAQKNKVLFFLLVDGSLDKMSCESIFLVNINLPAEYQDWVNDVTKFFIVLLTIHVLQYFSASTPSARGLFNATFWKFMLFTMIGFSAYYLVFRKIVRFQYQTEDENQSSSSLFATTFSPLSALDRFRAWIKAKL